ncbi:hypothetical protein [Bradyrhizobium japonicum]|uniref:hypothetical protein n=1 Tax=Bradyrhizobium japonicum TaxID=375 RepID=UPI0003F9D894|nr:hypothetical protein [Bradyrhizobium japonicum]
MTNQFKIGDRVVDRDGDKADVVDVSRDGKRIKVEMWVGGARPKLQRIWVAAGGFAKVEGSK